MCKKAIESTVEKGKLFYETFFQKTILKYNLKGAPFIAQVFDSFVLCFHLCI